MSRGLRIFGNIWLFALFALVVGGNLAFIYFAESKMDAISKVREDMSPFNISGWLVKMLLASPGVAAFWLSEKLKRPRL
jgi:hypothetical protein